jgi:hypothetical protein
MGDAPRGYQIVLWHPYQQTSQTTFEGWYWQKRGRKFKVLKAHGIRMAEE